MHFVALDALNPLSRPTPIKLSQLYPKLGARMVAFDDVRYYGYYHQLHVAGCPQAVLLTSQSYLTDNPGNEALHFAQVLAPEPPHLWLIGNEPNADPNADGSESSDPKTPAEFAQLWNDTVPKIKLVLPDAQCYIGGQLGDPYPGCWLERVLPLLVTPPDGVDVHYPTNETTLQLWQGFGLQISCMEWCFSDNPPERVTQEEMNDWVRVLSFYTTDDGWFTWPDETVPGMGLTRAGRKLKAFTQLHIAWAMLPAQAP